MRRVRSFGLGWLVALTCCGAESVSEASLGEPAVLRVGESVELPTESLRVGVSGVPEDSRCPEGVVCVWAGVATVAAWLEKDGGSRQELLLSTSEHAGRSRRAESLGYEIELVRLSPAKTGTMRQSDYRITLVVTAQ